MCVYCTAASSATEKAPLSFFFFLRQKTNISVAINRVQLKISLLTVSESYEAVAGENKSGNRTRTEENKNNPLSKMGKE